MAFHRMSVKYFVSEPEALDLAPLIGVFHSWIQKKCLDGQPIDVADYRHVFQGPGVMLIGHEFDYALDMGQGRPGLCYVRKRAMTGELSGDLGVAFHAVLVGCRMLTDERKIQPPLTFHTDEVILTLVDRLRAPNQKATIDVVRDEVSKFLNQLYGSSQVRVEADASDARGLCSLRIKAQTTSDLDTLLERLAADLPSAR